MNRDASLKAIRDDTSLWDVVVIGGGASGLGSAVDAASRGYRTLLLEKGDFACETSSRSTKLIHGGVRYLRQGHLGLVRKSLHERALLLQNAPHLVHPLPFILPTYGYGQLCYYGLGLKLYDLLAGRLNLRPSHRLSKDEVIQRVPTINREGLSGAICYEDAQFDDARLAISLAQTLTQLGGHTLNYAPVVGLLKESGKTIGVKVRDLENLQEHEVRAKVVVNATGAFIDNLRALDDASAPPLIAASQGTHLVLDRSLFTSREAMIIPNTGDGRVLFFIPWQDHVLVGTTDTPLQASRLDHEPRPQPQEIRYLLDCTERYLNHHVAPENILSVFAGIRPLVRRKQRTNTLQLARDYTLTTSSSGLVTLAGGKWTTYRKMGEDTVDLAAKVGLLPQTNSQTAQLRLYQNTQPNGDLSLLHPRLPCRVADVVVATRDEMARTVADVLARRTRCLFLDAKATLAVAPTVAKLMATQLNRDERWENQQVATFKEIAKNYLACAMIGIS